MRIIKNNVSFPTFYYYILNKTFENLNIINEVLVMCLLLLLNPFAVSHYAFHV